MASLFGRNERSDRRSHERSEPRSRLVAGVSGRWYPPELHPGMGPQRGEGPKRQSTRPRALWMRYRRWGLRAEIGVVATPLLVIAISIVHGTNKTAKVVSHSNITGGTATASGLSPTTTVAVAPPAHDSATGTAPTDRLTGFGASDTSWDSGHRADPRFAPGSAYDPDPSVGTADHDNRYYAVIHNHGRVVGYSMQMPNGTPIVLAKEIMLREFPRDVQTRWFVIRDSCAQMAVRSQTLSDSLAPSQGSVGDVVITLDTVTSQGPSYEPSNVNDAILLIVGSVPTPQDAPGC